MTLKNRMSNFKETFLTLRSSKRFHNLLVFLGFVVVATLFWFIMAMNDSVQDSFDVRLDIENVPDSVTFITEPPAGIHVTVRDKGTNLFRIGGMRHPVMHVNFNDFGDNGTFRLSHSDLLAQLKSTFGNGAAILSTSVDSLRLVYTTNKGKKVPVMVSADITPSAGNVVGGHPFSLTQRVTVYGPRDILDTITRVMTSKILRRNLSEPTDVEVSLIPIPGTRIIPSTVKVRLPIEPLVSKKTEVAITAVGVPQDETLLLYPSKVTVSYFTPLSKFNKVENGIKVIANYEDTRTPDSNRIPIRIESVSRDVVKPVAEIDSIEYTIVK